ncbi:hypothetical protein [Paenibacillus sp. N3.4]|uniref:hypothetical protein n=1 Tax=Paenibacillus sp. N3.4 TaxID=2603222 RepID=UPI0011CB0DC5|nr:hypothetical protein [Paenibacillus sp. N3.4]TXK84353.1 hypothetical protein FU659_08950 [Paenibacillus sp. N3.4]
MLSKKSVNPLKIILFSLMAMTIILTLVDIVWVTYTRSIDVTIQGVNYQLGAENSNDVQSESVRIKGSSSRSLNGLRTFKGTITFAHDTITVPEESREAVIHFDKNGYGPVIYGYFETSSSGVVMPRVYNSGVLFADSDFRSVTFLRMKEVVAKDGSKGGGWNGGDGLMFAGPATTREQALIISNELMKRHLQNADYVGGHFILK